MNVINLISLVSNILLVFMGVYIVIVIRRVYSLYRSLGFFKTVVTPFLLVGVMFAVCGITQLLEIFCGELGFVIHSLVMMVAAVFLLCGFCNYHKMLTNAERNSSAKKRSTG